MADLDSFRDLFEEFTGFRFTETFPGADVGMEVAVGTRKHQVQIAIAHEDLVEWWDTRMRVQTVVGWY